MTYRSSFQLACLLAAAASLWGCCCSKVEKPPAAPPLTAPYPNPRSVVVAPLMNQSPTDTFDTMVATDTLVSELAQVKGLTVLPTNQPLKLLVAKGQTHARTLEEAIQLAQALGVDGVVVGAITEYKPYKPMKVGMTLQLYWVRADTQNGLADPVELSRKGTDSAPAYYSGVGPAAQASHIYDASTNEVASQVELYARSHEGMDSPYGWRRYLADSDAYLHFVCHQLIVEMMQQELNRITVPATAP